MKSIGNLLFVLLLICSAGVANAACQSDYITDKDDEGGVITLGTGAVWEIDVRYRSQTSLWEPDDDVLVCDGGVIVNKDDEFKDDDETVTAVRVH